MTRYALHLMEKKKHNTVGKTRFARLYEETLSLE